MVRRCAVKGSKANSTTPGQNSEQMLLEQSLPWLLVQTMQQGSLKSIPKCKAQNRVNHQECYQYNDIRLMLL